MAPSPVRPLRRASSEAPPARIRVFYDDLDRGMHVVDVGLEEAADLARRGRRVREPQQAAVQRLRPTG